MAQTDAKNASAVAAGRKSSVRKRLTAWTKVATVGYGLLVFFWLLLVEGVAERSWVTSVALFVPPQVWLLPFAALLPFILFLNRRLLLIPVACSLFTFFAYMDFRVSNETEGMGKQTISVLSNNIGQRKTRTMWAFLKAEDPDIFLLQDAWNHKRAISSENPDRYVASHGEFLIASRFEIKRSGFVPNLVHRTPAAAWFEIDFHGQPVVIYNVHMPTPRTELMRFRGRGLFNSQARTAYKASLEKRIELSRKFLAHLQKEDRPFIVAGDFNMPDTGYLRRLYAAQLTDAFAAKGTGYGLTFPGWNWNPLTLFGPWLRIDYVFSSADWRPAMCRTEPRQPAQHLSVVARFELVSANAAFNGAPSDAPPAP